MAVSSETDAELIERIDHALTVLQGKWKVYLVFLMAHGVHRHCRLLECLLRHELERQGFAVILLRNGDDTLTLDQRAGSTNSARAGIYVSLHAATEGTGVRVYTALLPIGGPDRGPFHAWNAAQSPALPVSQSAAAAIVNEMQKHQFPARGYSVSLRPLNNLLMPALAVELAPGPNGLSDLPSANYQQKAAAAIADGIASLRDRLGAQP